MPVGLNTTRELQHITDQGRVDLLGLRRKVVLKPAGFTVLPTSPPINY